MKKRGVQVVIYLIATLALAGYFDALSGMEPMTLKQAAHYLPAIHAAQFGMIMLAAACVLSLFSLRYGALCGLAACIASWPFLARPLHAIPWGHFFTVLGYSNWNAVYAATFALVISNVFSITQLWLLFKKEPSNRIV